MRKTILFLVVIAVLVFGGVFHTTGLAQSVDQLLVIDDAKIFGNRISEVEAGAKKLLSSGADIRVRTILTYGAAGNLDRYEEQVEQQSPSWTDASGDRKNNLIVLIVSLQERQTGLYYGAYWADIMESNWMRVQTDIMNPLFRNGDYAGGAVKGLAEIQRLVEGKGQAQAGTQTTAGRSNWWVVLLVILVIVGSIIGLFLFRSHQKSRARQLAIRQKAMLAKQAAASAINELIEATQMLEIKVNVTADKIAMDEAVPLRSGLEKARGLINQSSQAYSELSHSAGDPENPRLGEAELGMIEPQYQKILGDLRQARERVRQVEEQIDAVRETIDGFPGKVNEVNVEIEAALRKQDELNKAGYKTTYPAELISKGRGTLKQAQDLVSQKRFTEGMKYAILAGGQIRQAVQVTEELPRKKQEAEAAIPALASRIEQVKETINNGRAVFERLFQEYAETTWEPVRGNGTEAENRVNWALDALDDARSAIGLEQQEWHKASGLIDKGNSWLTEAESLMKSISQLEVNLIAARRDAPGEIDAAQADITKAWEYINRYDEDIRESLEDDLRSAEKKNDVARGELKRAKPDYFNVCSLARDANESADRVLVQARDEHETAERLRAKAASTRRDAHAKVSIASKYIEDHHPVVQSEARNYLVNAIEALRQADAAIDTNAQISLATQAESAANQAYTLAQRDVNSTNMNIPNIGIPTIFFPPMGHPSGGSPSWGSRRSSGSGSMGRGGGGSSSWGSRGGSIGGGGFGRGGGSTGW